MTSREWFVHFTSGERVRGRCPLDDEVEVLSVAVGGTLGGLVSAGTGEKSDNGGGGGGGNWKHKAALAIDEGGPW
ncbi:hypothetical protein HYQ46_007085 [Verticillium longisporum]|nr:hypothetical protein HYQ46_007085 [Verticillium longisporum]